MKLQTVVVATLFGACVASLTDGQTLPTVRVVTDDAIVYVSRIQRATAIATPTAGTEYEALDASDGWVWVLLEPDLDGTRQPGWIDMRHVEIPTTGAAGYSMRGVAAELESERAASEARLAEAQAALERAREEYREATGSDAATPTADPPRP